MAVTAAANPHYIPKEEAAQERAMKGNAKMTATIGTTFEWNEWGKESVVPRNHDAGEKTCTVTAREIAEIKKRAGTSTVDLGRAEAVKWAMQNGCNTLSEVVECVCPPYRPTQVSIYLAALKATNNQ